jgi:hypothetical protein
MLRIFARLFVGFVTAIVLLACGLMLLVTQTRFLVVQVNSALDRYVESEYPVRVEVGEIEGTLVSGLVLRRVLVDYDDGETRYPLLTVNRIDVRYSPLDLFRHGLDFRGVRVDRAVLSVRANEDGRWLVPDFSSDKPESGGTDVSLSVGELIVDRSAVRLPDGSGSHNTVSGISLRMGGEIENGRADLSVDELSAVWRERLLVAEGLRGGVVAYGDTIILNDVGGAVGASRLDLDATLTTTGSVHYYADLHGTRVCIDEMSAFFDKKVRGDVVVTGRVSGRDAEMGGNVRLDGDLFERTLDGVDVEFTLQDGHLVLDTLTGSIFGAAMTGDGSVDFTCKPNAYAANLDISNFDLQQAVPKAPLTTDLSGRVSLAGSSFSKRSFRVAFDVELADAAVAHAHFDSLSGSLETTGRELAFESNFRATYGHGRAVFSGRVGYDDSIAIRGHAACTDLRDFWGMTPVREIGGTGEADFAVNGKPGDPDLVFFGHSDSLHVYGVTASDVRVEADVERIMSERVGWAEIVFGKSDAYGLEVLSGRALVNTSAECYDVEELDVRAPLWRLEGNAWAEVGADTAWVTVGRAAFVYRSNLVVLDEPATVSVSDGTITVDSLRLVSGLGTVDLGVTKRPAGVLNVWWNAVDVDVAPWFAMVRPEPAVGGLLSTTGRLSGTQRYPRIAANWRLRDVSVDGNDLGVCWGRALYRTRRLIVPEMRMADGKTEMRGEASLPLDLALCAVESRVVDDDLYVRATVEGNGQGIVPTFVSPVEHFTGQLRVEAVVTGRPSALSLSGSGRLRDGFLKLVDISDPFVRVVGDARFSGGRVVIDSVRADVDYEYEKTGSIVQRIWAVVSGGSETGTGTVFLSGALDVSDPSRMVYDSMIIVARDFFASYLPVDVEVLVDADLVVSGPDPPTVTGTVSLERAVYREPFVAPDSLQREVSLEDAAKMWNYELLVIMPGNVWVQNDVASVELEGELRVVREYGETVVLGQLSPVRGSFFLAATATAFSVQGGTVTFDDVENLDPALDVSASARVSDFDIDVHIGGRLSEPILSLAGHSGEIVLGEQDVLAILALGDTTGVSVGSRAGSYASSLFLSTIESTARRTLGVEQFEVTYGEFEGDTEERGLSVTLGKYISPRLYVRYTRPLSVTATGDLAAEYRLSRRWTAGADWDEYDLFHLSLRFKWDY